MSFVRKSPNSKARFRKRIASFALYAIVALCLVRFASAIAPSPVRQQTVSSAARDGYHPYLDHDGLEWTQPTPRFTVHLPQLVVLHPPMVCEAQSLFETKGVHYDRPPPAC
ncbi:MAG TPA: hypothetical protein VFA68_00890 [Terriglobales bacterium]|nr:hypothetical protein [Terriglobales bacterium]